MKRWFYYYRDKENRPLVTVCLIGAITGDFSKGISICSDSDNPDKKEGRFWAWERAVRALIDRKGDDPILREEPFEVLKKIDPIISLKELDEDHTIHKSIFNPNLTEFEKRLVHME